MEDFIKKNCEICGKEFSASKFNPYINHCKDCGKILKKERRKQRALEKTSIPLDKFYTCETCGKSFNVDYRKYERKTPPRFCCDSCARAYSSSKVDREFHRQIMQKKFEPQRLQKLKEKEEHKAFVSKGCIRTLFNPKSLKIEDIVYYYRYPENCILGKFERSLIFKNHRYTGNLIKTGFDFWNRNWEEEFFKIRNKIYNLYYVEKLSLEQLQAFFEFKSVRTSRDFLKLFGFFKFRNYSEGVSNALEKGTSGIDKINKMKSSNYYQGSFLSKSEETFFYRSSYELELSKFLESKDIKYTLNKFKIKYKSSKDNSFHFGFPDFYLPDFKLIIETKNLGNFDEIDLNDRYLSLKELGLDFLVIEAKIKYPWRSKDHHNYEFKGFKILKDFSNNSNTFLEILKEKLA